MKKHLLTILVASIFILIALLPGCNPSGQTLGAIPPYYPIVRTSALVVVGANVTASETAQADYICTGTADQVKINAAISTLTVGRTHFETITCIGDFVTSATITVPSLTILDLSQAKITSPGGFRQVTVTGTGKVVGGLVYTLPYPAVVAHRGIPSIAPENTMESFRCAAESNVPIIETDVYQAFNQVDGLIMHDNTVNRMTTSTGYTFDYTSAAWQNLIINVQGNTGWGNGYQYYLGGTGVDAWTGTYHPPLLSQFLSEFGGKKVLMLDNKAIGGGAVLTKIIQRYNLVGSVIIDCETSYSEGTVPIAAGIMCEAGWDGTTPFATLASDGFTFVNLDVATGQVTLANINSAHAAGLRVNVSVLDRQNQYLALPTAVEGVYSDDAVYMMGIVNGDYHYRRTSDPFLTNTWYDGMPGYGSTYQRGIFTSGRFGFNQESHSVDYTLQGWACPLANAATSYTIALTMTYDQLDSDTSRFAGVFICCPQDLPAMPSVGATGVNGYLISLNEAGGLRILKYVNGVGGTSATQSSAGISSSQAVPITIAVTPTTITLTRKDTGAYVTMTDSSYRGGYFYFGEGVNTGSATKLHSSFSAVRIN